MPPVHRAWRDAMLKMEAVEQVRRGLKGRSLGIAAGVGAVTSAPLKLTKGEGLRCRQGGRVQGRLADSLGIRCLPCQ